MTGSDMRVLRERLSMTQHQLADALSTPVATIRNWEQGRRHIPPIAVAAMKLLEAACANDSYVRTSTPMA